LVILVNNAILLLIPDLKNKVNYFYKVSEKLHKFDEATVILNQNNKKFVLKIDAIQIIIEELNNILKKAKNKKIALPNNLSIGQLGYIYNQETYKNIPNDTINFSKYWLWSIRDIQTWLYNKKNKIYIEISPSYPWLYIEPEKTSEFITFDKFMTKYKPLLIAELNNSLIEKWITECENILSYLEENHIQLLQHLSQCKTQFINALKAHAINIAQGEVTFSDLNSSFNDNEQSENLNGEIQITYWFKEIKQPKYIIQILLENGIFYLNIIKDSYWQTPIFQKTFSTFTELFYNLQKAVTYISTKTI